MKSSLLAGTCLAAVLVLLVLIPTAVAQQDQTGATRAPPVWLITGDISIVSETRSVGTNITVASGAKLTIVDSTLSFFPNETKPFYHFTVEKGGELVIENSVITASEIYLSYILWCHGKVTIKNSTFSHLASQPIGLSQRGGIVIDNNGSVVQNNHIYYGNIGVTLVNCAQVIFKDNHINGTYYGIFSEGCSAQVQGNTVRDSVYGIYDVDSSATYSGFQIYNCFEGVYSLTSNSRFTQGTFNNSNIGVVVFGSQGVSVDNNTIKDNNKAVQAADGELFITNNQVLGGLDGINIEFAKAHIKGNTISGQKALVVEDKDCSGCTKPTLEGYGAGIHLLASDSIIQGNTLDASNIGIFSDYSSPTIRSNTITGMFDPIDCNTSCRVDENIITFETLTLITGVGILIENQDESAPLISGNQISDNQNDGIFTGEASPELTGNTLTGNGGYGVHTLDQDIGAFSGNTFADNLGNFAYSVYMSFRTLDPYGDIVPYSEVTISDPETNASFTQPDLGIGHFSAVLLSFTSGNLTQADAATDFHTYDLTFKRNGESVTKNQLVTPQTDTYQNVTIPLYRPELSIKDLKIEYAAKDQKTKLTAAIENTGDAEAGNVTVYFISTYESESRVIGTDRITLIEVGQTQEATLYWTPGETGEFVIIIDLDPEDGIKEIDETNNKLAKDVTMEEKSDMKLFILAAALIILIIIIAIIVVFYVIKMKAEREDEEPPEEPRGRRGRSGRTGVRERPGRERTSSRRR